MVDIKKIRLLLLFFVSALLCACSTLSYVGDDYKEENTQTVKTNEDFVFNVYKKTMENINLKAGISRTPIPEVLVLYVQVENLSYETPYVFKVEDLRVSDPMKEIQFITTNNYLSIYQEQL